MLLGFWFQSLFWWMLVLNTKSLLMKSKPKQVSILVLVDVGLKPERFFARILKAKTFQSLFWWMLVLNLYFARLAIEVACVSILVLVDVGLKPFI